MKMNFDAPSGRFELLVESIGEPEVNTLRVLLRESFFGESTAEGKYGARKLQPMATDRLFEVTWDRYVAYYVLNESFSKPLADGTWHASYPLKSSRDSNFLEYLKAHSIASDDYPGGLVHWSIGSGNHIVEVVSTDAPDVKQLNGV